MTDTNAILAERQKTHGDFTDHARITQETKYLWHATANWARLSIPQREALDMIAHKVGRILAGDPNHADHWEDIAGYAKLVVPRLGASTPLYANPAGHVYGSPDPTVLGQNSVLYDPDVQRQVNVDLDQIATELKAAE